MEAQSYLDLEAANGFSESIHLDHLSPFHLFSTAWTGVLSRRRHEYDVGNHMPVRASLHGVTQLVPPFCLKAESGHYSEVFAPKLRLGTSDIRSKGTHMLS